MAIKKKYKGLIFLWVATLVFASANSVIDKLNTLGENHLINNHNPISFCNVLFLGNIFAGLVFLIIYYKTLRFTDIKRIKLEKWSMLSLTVIVSTILEPVFYFWAIMHTFVINVVLISSSEIVWTLILGYLFFREKASWFMLLSTCFAIVGVGITFYLHQPEFIMTHLNSINTANEFKSMSGYLFTLPKSGEICALLGAFFASLGDQLSKKYVVQIPEGIFNIYHTLIGAIFFFFVALSIYGWSHFAELFSPFLWEWMLFYGIVIVALGVYTWNRALETVNTSNLAISNAFFPIAGIFFAYLIVGEIPDKAQIIGGIVIFIGISIGLFDTLKIQTKLRKKLIGFHGV